MIIFFGATLPATLQETYKLHCVPTLEIVDIMLHTTVAEVESAPTSAASHATFPTCPPSATLCATLRCSLWLLTNEFPPLLLVTADHRHRTCTLPQVIFLSEWISVNNYALNCWGRNNPHELLKSPWMHPFLASLQSTPSPKHKDF